jgi:hypothetical protein
MQKFLKVYKMALHLIHFKAVALLGTAFELSLLILLLFLFSIVCTTTAPSYSQLLQPGASDHLLTSSSSQKNTPRHTCCQNYITYWWSTGTNWQKPFNNWYFLG